MDFLLITSKKTTYPRDTSHETAVRKSDKPDFFAHFLHK